MFHHLEDSRSHGNEQEAERARGQGARPAGLRANQAVARGSRSTDLRDQGKPCDYGWFDPTAQVHLGGLYKQGPWPLEEGNSQTLIHSFIQGEEPLIKP